MSAVSIMLVIPVGAFLVVDRRRINRAIDALIALYDDTDRQ
jgi:hypothetical protein